MLKIVAPLSRRSQLYRYSNSREDYYSVLKVSRTATQQEIRAKYYEMVKKYHPDVNNDQRTRMQLLNEAYAVLSHAERRKEYDRQLGAEGNSGQSTTANNREGTEREEYRRGNEREEYRRSYGRYGYEEMRRDSRGKNSQPVWNDINPLIKSFMFGLIFMSFYLIFAQPDLKPQPQTKLQTPLPPKYTKQQFDLDLQDSLMKTRRELL